MNKQLVRCSLVLVICLVLAIGTIAAGETKETTTLSTGGSFVSQTVPVGPSFSSSVPEGLPLSLLQDSGGLQGSYAIGSPVLRDLWVDPVLGNDMNSGSSRGTALKTVSAAWDRIPRGGTFTTGYRVLLCPGHYTEDTLPPNGWMESPGGSYQYPVIIQAADGPHTAFLHGYLNIQNTRYFYLVDLDFVTDRGYGGGGNVVHVANASYILLRNCTLSGFDGAERQPQETLKANQVQHLYVESCDISGAFWYPLDFVAVQYGHVTGNRVHDAGEFCMVIKGGSAYLRVEGNEVFNGSAGGISIGSGTGFNWMVPPWIHYEAEDIRCINNIIHDADGAGLSVNGGYNILLAYNTLCRVGARSHAIEVVQGSRGCDGDGATCTRYVGLGGWGTAGSSGQFIPDRNVYIYNNLLFNPPGYRSQWNHFSIFGPVVPPAGSNVPSPARADDNLRIAGNLVWNGPFNLPLGIEDSSLDPAQVIRDNTINTVEPALVDPSHGDYRPLAGGSVYSSPTYAIPDFPGGDRPAQPPSPDGDLDNTVSTDYSGMARTSSSPPGAFAGNSGPGTVPAGCISPGNLVYRGAFRVPDDGADEYGWAYGGGGLSYYPGGDPLSPDDGYPGSLFGMGHDQRNYVAEISVPEPVISPGKQLVDLHRAVALQPFSDLYAGIFTDSGQGVGLRGDICYLPAQGSQSSDKLYLSFAEHFQYEQVPSHAWSELDLSNPQVKGPWLIGSYDNFCTNDYLFEVPAAWAAEHLSGYRLATGRFRDGSLGGSGPSLFAIAPWLDGNPPAPGARLAHVVPLLLYEKEYEGSTRVMNNYTNADEWSGGAWVTSDDGSTVVFAGTRGIGDCWYGFSDGTVWPDNPPFPPVPPAPADERGWWAEGFEGVLLFYNPGDLAKVASGQMAASSPQPYAVLDLDPYLYHVTGDQQKRHLGAVAFDRGHGYLFVTEFMADGVACLVHVWQVQPAAAGDTPVITGISPASGVNTGSVPVTITGSNFRAGASVTLTWGSTVLTGTGTALSESRIQCTLPLAGATAGQYDLAVRNTDGTSGLLRQGFTVTSPVPQLTAVFSANRTTGAIPLTIRFTDTSTGSPTAWNWSFGDGTWFNTTTPALKNATKTYTASGSYTVRLRVSNAAGANLTNPGTVITANPPLPVANFTGSPRSGNAPLTVRFNDTSTGTGITAYQWLFSDGTTYYATRDITHIFTRAGTYHVNHSVTNAGGTAWKNLTGYITVSSGPAPTVSSITPSTGKTGKSVNITSLAGANFRSGATVRLQKTGQADITATNTVVASATRIRCRFEIPSSAATGSWDVVVTNSDGTTGKKPGGFSITAGSTPASPTVTSIYPSSGRTGTTVTVTNLAGTNFRSGATVKLQKTGQGDIPGTSIAVVSGTKITCRFGIPSSASTGAWDVVVRNSDGTTGKKAGGFTVIRGFVW